MQQMFKNMASEDNYVIQRLHFQRQEPHFHAIEVTRSGQYLTMSMLQNINARKTIISGFRKMT